MRLFFVTYKRNMPPECLVCSPSVFGHTPRLGQGAGKADKKITPPAARKGGLEKIFSREVFYFTSHLVFSASRLISLLPTLPPDAPAFYPRRAVAHQPLAMPDAHSLLMPEEAAARNMGNTKPAFGKKKVSIAIKKISKMFV